MKTWHGVDVCYNGHVAAESGNHLITDYSLDNSANDYASVPPLAGGEQRSSSISSAFPQTGVSSLC